MLKFALAVLLLICAPLWVSAAQAADKLAFGPPPEWVKPVKDSFDGPAPEAANPALRLILLDQQTHFGPEGMSTYQQRVGQARNAQGLAALGSIVLSWSPDTDTVTVHRLKILRGDQAIDVLAKQSFAVLRRETNLQQAMLDGVLTAALQPEGLQVGDIVDLAYTLTRSDPVMGGHADTMVTAPDSAGVIERLRFRAIWSEPKSMTWRASRDMLKPKVSQSGKTTEVTLDLRDLPPLKGPEGAPRRFAPRRDLEFSDFRDWAEVSALMAPYYDKASRLRPDSPLKDEVARIRAASADPKVRVAAALRLVQDQVRYLALVIPDGGLTPVDADVTWERRFGDCKAKTVLLIALLRELDIPAEAAAVNAFGSPGLRQRLPRVGVFNHVIVRLELDGRIYWLDGTRTGDRSLDSIRPSRFDFALPVRTAGATLEQVIQSPLDRPQLETILTVDQSAGIEAPAPVRGEVILRGEPARVFTLGAAAQLAVREGALKSFWSRYGWIEVKTSKVVDQPGSSDVRILMEGTGKGGWVPDPSGRVLRAPSADLGGPATFKREPGSGANAPFAVDHPVFTAFKLVVTLPDGGRGFATPAPDVDVATAGRAFTRRTRVEKGVLTIESTVQSLVEEFSAAEAPAAAAALGDMAKTKVVVRAPANYRATAGDVAALLAAQPQTAGGYLDRGSKLMTSGRTVEALADFEKAVAADPASAFAYAYRGSARAQKGDLVLAKADFDKALSLDPRNYMALQGQGMLALRELRYADAAAAFGRAADLRPNNIFALVQRSIAYRALGDTDRALADLDEILRFAPDSTEVRISRATLLRERGEGDKALAELGALIISSPDNGQARLVRGGMLASLGRRAEAEADFAAALAADPGAGAYLTRARWREKTDLASRLADIDAALKLEPDAAPAKLMRAEALSEAGRHAEAAKAVDSAMKGAAEGPELLVARAAVQARAGKLASALKDIAQVREKSAGNAGLLNNLCWTQATLGMALEAALGDCQAALQIAPKEPATLDSKAFVLLRLGRFKEALEVYDQTLALRPRQAASLYGRGVTRMRLGMSGEAEADLVAARKEDVGVDAEFAAYKVTP